MKRRFDENTPLHLAAQHSDMNEVTEILLEKEAHINASNMDG